MQAAQAGHAKPLWRSIVETLIAIGMLLFLAQALFSTTVITGEAMSPTLRTGQSLLVSRVPYVLNAPARGDVVVVRNRIDPSILLAMRVVGLPGDRVNVKGAQISINDQPLREPYLAESSERLSVGTTTVGQYRVGQDEYFLVNDNRVDIANSRSSGMFTRDDLYGRAWLVYWPIESIKAVAHIRPTTDP